MHVRSRIVLAFITAVSLLGAVGCKQDIGEPCDVDEDCAAMITCCGVDLPDRRGICTAPSECVTGFDGGPRPDGGPDAGPRDAGPVDAGPDAAVRDAGTDAGTDAGSDAGGAADAGSDAGSVDAGP